MCSIAGGVHLRGLPCLPTIQGSLNDSFSYRNVVSTDDVLVSKGTTVHMKFVYSLVLQ